ncbi:hypothetical protein [Niallia circulans]|uniref:Uncharacterized protein n=1 Tax=Niallia circulans TaxID=1397 RepID=A0A941GEJ7_NIACI|nr:hypothetical protein [Niallia circulans]MCB5235453.1 hypothetical protein [Niallia circulans]
MSKEKMISIDEALLKYKDPNGNQLKIPLFSSVKVANNKIYVEIDEDFSPIPNPKVNRKH